ncbi:Anti-sigma regulatory factor (Ser/Thr protein kinase) [Actinokineospora terrae]|uniref:Anti-sigma regulatory factor (Ser/Thr protein kinase) n=1 Tax=Actinokineospora terrae TaxID=155974 RepID=A0A1H9KDM6_9PSEU|nr:Anti-sigma regulatory factor (Ser/Thr protein kinase) [Actinokineospora terrae]
MSTAPGAGETGSPTTEVPGPGVPMEAPVTVTAESSADHITVRLPARAEHVVTVRNHVRVWLADFGVAIETARNIVMATDEAVTNAIDHRFRPEGDDGAVTLTLHAKAKTIVVTVAEDGSWQLPAQGNNPIDGGFNLPLLRVLADEVQLRHSDGRSTLVAHFPHRG